MRLLNRQIETPRRPAGGVRRITLSILLGLALLAWSINGCRPMRPAPTPTPTKTPRPTFTVTLPPTPAPSLTPTTVPSATDSPTVAPPEPTSTSTTAPSVTETAPPAPTDTPSPTPVIPSPTAPPATLPPPTSTPVPPTLTPVPPAPTPAPTTPPQQGGDWDLEAGFYEWASPYEDFVGHIANGWSPLIKVYKPDAVPRFNENKFVPNIHSGERSQEISFDYRNGEMGLWRAAAVTPGHRYTVVAWAKYAPSLGGLNLFLGIDLTGGENFVAGTVTWYPWREMTPDQWIATSETVVAAGGRMTIFLRAVHPVAEAGGNTMFDNISLIDEGG